MIPFARIVKYGNQVAPLTRVPIFRLENFSTVADIKDTGPYGITVNKPGITVGSDSIGTYMNFNGTTGNYIYFGDAQLALETDYEIEIKLSGFTYRAGTYSNAIFDSRPMNTNGNYLYSYYTSNTPAPFKIGYTIPTTSTTVTGDATSPYIMSIKCQDGFITASVNDTVIKTTPAFPFTGLNCKIGQNAFIASAAVPYLVARIYSFTIYRLL